MLKRIHPSTIIATAALFFSLGGGALAASHYLITNVNQIKPSVRHALRGNTGPQGPAGPQGAQGAPGPQGAQGAALATENPSVSMLLTCSVADIDYARFGATPEPITLTWTDNGATVKTQTVDTQIPEYDDNTIEIISAAAPAIPAGDVLGLTASWSYAGGGQVGPNTVVAYC